MSLSNPSLLQVVKKQYAFKLKAYAQVFFSLVITQLIGVFFSLGASGGMSGSSESIQMKVNYYSTNNVVFFTMLWAFITAITITTKAYRNDDFAFVANRISSNLSNVLFLLTASIVGGITATLSTYLIKVILVYFFGYQLVTAPGTMAATNIFLLGLSTTIFYFFLICSLGYFFGTLVQINKIFIVLLPAAFIGLLTAEGTGKVKLATAAVEFIFTESSILLFFIKVIASAGLLLTCAFILADRMEVRQ